MTEQSTNYSTIAPLSNVAAMAELYNRLETREPGLPGLGVFSGPAGFGKSFAGLFLANSKQACLVQVKDCWTKKALCQAVLRDLGVVPAKAIYEMVDQISEILARTDTPLLVDEADILVRKGMVEIVRDIYESSFTPVILIGEELLPQKLRKWERVHSRVLQWTQAKAADARDLEVLKSNLCPDIEIDPKILSEICKASHGSVRRMVVNLSRLKEFAAAARVRQVSAAVWTGEFDTGATPQPRRKF